MIAVDPDEILPFVALNGDCPPVLRQPPMVSVVICAYNAERTMEACLESLRKLDYPNYEVVVVDDGSRDRTAEISARFPEFRLIRQPNKGLSVARNVGMQAARGEIIAYTDSDCVVDSHWLRFMVGAMTANGFDACGGPNYAPHEEGRTEACVSASPGAPCHVLTAEDRAEHLAGCNMVFRKDVLQRIGGFDPQFTAAGDDVDICWRALDAGFVLGFCPAAFVWHFRRNTVKAYYNQQRGYGKAEAMLYLKYPDRFNALGQVMWRGRIPGLARTMPGVAGAGVVGEDQQRVLPDHLRTADGLAQVPAPDPGMERPVVGRPGALLYRAVSPRFPPLRCLRWGRYGRSTTLGRRRWRNATKASARGSWWRSWPLPDRCFARLPAIDTVWPAP